MAKLFEQGERENSGNADVGNVNSTMRNSYTSPSYWEKSEGSWSVLERSCAGVGYREEGLLDGEERSDEAFNKRD